jgi:hypothetical protein
MLSWLKSKVDKVAPTLPEQVTLNQSTVQDPVPSIDVGSSGDQTASKGGAKNLADTDIGSVEAKPADPLVQLTTLNATFEDVVAAYKIFLGRLPESVDLVQDRLGIPCDKLLIQGLTSKEFLDKHDNQKIILAIAKKILEMQKLEGAPTESDVPETKEAG